MRLRRRPVLSGSKHGPRPTGEHCRSSVSPGAVRALPALGLLVALGSCDSSEPWAVIRVERAGRGAGTVRSSEQPPTIDCGPSCSAGYPPGALVELAASPEAGSVFEGWSGDCAGAGSCRLSVTATGAVASATFGLEPVEVVTPRPPVLVPVAVELAGEGSGSVTSTMGLDCGTRCQLSVPQGTSFGLEARPARLSVFGGWSGACAGTGACRVSTATPSVHVSARFDRATFAVTVRRLGTGEGVVRSVPAGLDCGENCDGTYVAGSRLELVADAAPGTRFAGWRGDCAHAGTVPTCGLEVLGPRTVEARFDRVRYTVAVRRTGNGRIVSTPAGIDCGRTCSASFDAGTTVTLAATADECWSFAAGWGGACSGRGRCVLAVDGPLSADATFELTRPTLTVTRAGVGTGRVLSAPSGINCGGLCQTSFECGTRVVLTGAAAPGSWLASWGGACAGTGDCALDLTEDTSVQVSFER